MPKPVDNLSALFRSLGPDDTSFQAAETVAAREAAQRWPLFQAVSPKKSEMTPVLSAQERQRWNQQDPVAAGERKPALSVPGLSDKIAASLGKMSGRAAPSPVAAVTQNLAKRAHLEASPAVSRSQRSAPQATPRASRSAPLSTSPRIPQNSEPPQLDGALVSRAEVGHKAASQAARVAAPADDSLTGVFGRLEGKLKDLPRPTDKKSSFLSRLGKR